MKTIIITGASSGIGEATVRALAARGHQVVAAARREDRLAAVVESCTGFSGEVRPVRCDVSKRSDVKALVEATMDAYGRIDVLVNNAGVMPLGPYANCRMDDWDTMIDINLKGVLYGIGHVLPIMLEQRTGHIVNVSSVAGRRLFNGAGVYSATKHAVHALSEGLRYEMSELGKKDGNTIRVTIIAPGVVTTELPESITDPEYRELSTEYYRTFKDPLTSEDAADTIVYAIEAPPHVNINEILYRPVSQVK